MILELIRCEAALLNQMQADEVVLFDDAVHPIDCWAAAGTALAGQQASGHDRLTVYSAIDLETGRIKPHFIPTYRSHLDDID